MSSGKIKKIKFFFEDADCVFFVVLLENIRVAGGERRASALIYKYIIMYMYKYMYIFIYKYKYKYKFIYKYIYIVQTPAKNNI